MLCILKKKRKSRTAGLLTLFLTLSMGFALFVTPAAAVSRSELDALKQQQEQLAQQKSGIQAQYDEISGRVSSQKQRLDLLTDQLDITNSEIENLSQQIAIYTGSIAEMENQLNIDSQKEQELLAHYKIRVRAMEENGKFTYLAILFGAKSFDDLLSRIDCIQEIMEYDSGLVEDVRAAQAKVQDAKADMEAEMAEQEKVCAEYKEKQAELLSQQAEVEDVLESLQADSAEYESQLASVSALQTSLSGQISDMEAELAELERIRAEQEAARRSAAQGSSQGSQWYGDTAGTASGQDIVDYAMNFLGVSYVYGGTSPSGFDCSGLVYYCYRHFGYSVNRTAAGLAYNGTEVSSYDLQPGDVILFTSSDGSYIGHTGLYIGNGQFIHAPHTGDVVKVSSLSDAYYTNHYWGARRVVS
jgi:cell wall-associated NlpC family hydrolase